MAARIQHFAAQEIITLPTVGRLLQRSPTRSNSRPLNRIVDLSQSSGPASGSPTYPDMDQSGYISDSSSNDTGLQGEMMDRGICRKRKH